MFHEAIEECIESLGPTPRRVSWWDRITYWQVKRPKWLKKNPGELETFFDLIPELRRYGRVVWGHIVQANRQLFTPGPLDCPADVVFSLDDASRVDPRRFSAVARGIYALKETQPWDPELSLIAEYVTNEMAAQFGLRIPREISSQHRCLMSTIYIIRKHLPGRAPCLRQKIMPLLVNPEPPHVVMVLPSRYWPDQLIDWWEGV